MYGTLFSAQVWLQGKLEELASPHKENIFQYPHTNGVPQMRLIVEVITKGRLAWAAQPSHTTATLRTHSSLKVFALPSPIQPTVRNPPQDTMSISP